MTESEEVNQFEQLRNEMQSQYNALKESFESAIREKDESIAKLTQDNKDLQAALLKSAFTQAPQPSEPVKTEEQMYEETIKTLYEKSKTYQKMI